MPVMICLVCWVPLVLGFFLVGWCCRLFLQPTLNTSFSLRLSWVSLAVFPGRLRCFSWFLPVFLSGWCFLPSPWTPPLREIIWTNNFCIFNIFLINCLVSCSFPCFFFWHGCGSWFGTAVWLFLLRALVVLVARFWLFSLLGFWVALLEAPIKKNFQPYCWTPHSKIFSVGFPPVVACSSVVWLVLVLIWLWVWLRFSVSIAVFSLVGVNPPKCSDTSCVWRSSYSSIGISEYNKKNKVTGVEREWHLSSCCFKLDLIYIKHLGVTQMTKLRVSHGDGLTSDIS